MNYFHAHVLAFMPHDENLILVMKDSVLDRVTAKDVGEELGILIRDTILPEEIGGMACSVREKTKLNHPFTDMLDRFLGELP